MDTLLTFNSTMTAIGAALVELCQSMPGVVGISIHADVEDGVPYSSVMAYGPDEAELISFHRFWGEDE